MNRASFFLYQCLTLLFLPLILLFAGIHILLKPENFEPYLQKFSFLLPKYTPKIRKRIWLHAVSVGEVLSCDPLIRLLREKEISVYLSTGTPSGFGTARSKYPEVQVFYFPFDYDFICTRLIRRIQPGAVLLCEMEIWPSFIYAVKKHGIPIYLISGRMPEAEFYRYRLFRFLFKHVLSMFDGIFMQSDIYSDRMRKLCNHGNIKTLGSLKSDVVPNPTGDGLKNILPEGILICAASTHEGDEEAIVNVYARLRRKHPHIGLVIAPRHTERKGEVTGILKKYGIDYTLRSSGKKYADRVFILDTLGELTEVFSRCSLVVMGGSFAGKVGGHNLIEPCLYGKCVLCGEHMENFEEIYRLLREANGIVVTSRENLFNDLDLLLQHPEKAVRIGKNAFDVIERSKGASERICSEIFC